MESVGSFMMECIDLFHASNVVTSVISVGIAGRVHEFVFIAIRWAMSRPVSLFSFLVKYITLHL